VKPLLLWLMVAMKAPRRSRGCCSPTLTSQAKAAVNNQPEVASSGIDAEWRSMRAIHSEQSVMNVCAP
jgi:hypothetical protein